MFQNIKDKLYVKTFNGFDLYKNGKLIYFPSAKSKELLAYLINQEGKFVQISKLTEALFEDSTDMFAAKKGVYRAYERLIKCLKEWGSEDIILKRKGSYAVDTKKIICDSYEMKADHEGVADYFIGEYMPDYSWAEVGLSNLLRAYSEKFKYYGAAD